MGKDLTVVCKNEDCENYDFEIVLEDHLGNIVFCGPCGEVISEEKDWYDPSSLMEEVTSEDALNLISTMSEEEKKKLIATLTEE